jgi:tripartite-type tricarboxylate transporter receptor subunit TctC
MKRRLMISAVVLMAGSALAQAPGGRPVRLVVPFGAGTSTDIVGRILSESLGRSLGQAVIVDNRPGAGGTLGSDLVAKAAGDGQTLLLGTVGTHAINATLFKRLSYDPLRDFVPLGFVGATPTLLVVPAASPWKSLADLRAASDERVSFASAGNGTSGHLAGEMVNARLGKSFLHVPYRDGGQALTELIAGNVQFMFYHPAAVLPHMRAGRLRALGVSSAKRSAAAPEVPTLAEQGLQGFDLVAWFMLYAPSGMESGQRERLRDAVRQVLSRSDVREKLMGQGIEPADMNGEQMTTFGANEVAKWGEAVRRSGAQLD